MLDVGQVGRARRRGGAGIQLFALYPLDSSSSSGGGGGYTPPAELLGALEAAAGGATEVGPGGVGLERASEATPGLPPTASAGSFVRVARGSSGSTGGTVPAVLLSDFDAAFRGSTFQSQHDTADTTDADSIAATAVVLARAAHALALGGGGDGAEPAAEAEQQLPVDYAALKGTVEGLMQVGAACLTACPPARPPACLPVAGVVLLAAHAVLPAAAPPQLSARVSLASALCAPACARCSAC